MRDYEDFEVWISADGEGGGYRVRANEAGEWRFELNAEALREKARHLAEAFEGQDLLQAKTFEEAKDFGHILFRAIFPLPIYGKLREARARRGFTKKSVRLRLHFDRAGSLVGLPWELLFDGERFFCLSAETPVVRHPEFLGSVEDPSRKSPFRVLAVLPEPFRQADLDAQGELLDIQAELASRIQDGSVFVEPLERPTFRGLMERLKVAPRVQALHFAGHGETLPEFGDGALCLEQEGRIRRADSVPGFALAPVLSDAKELRFVFLNACEGGRSASIENPENLAHRLLEAGVPAVLALQTPIGNRAAKTFCRAFYHLLAKGCSLEESVAAGRQALQTGAFGLAWASPVLYLRAATGQVIWPKFPWRRVVLLCGAFILALGIALAAREGKRIYDRLTHAARPHSLTRRAPDPACPSPRGLDFAFVKIPSGEFTMGAPARRGDRAKERPAHKVVITKSFCIGAYEVTDRQFNAVLTGRDASTSPGFDLPKTGDSWNEAQDFVAKLNQRDPEGHYRLAWEAELEYAGRAGSSAAYIYGDQERDLEGQANYLDTDGYKKVAPIGSFDPNRWGLYDVHGNVEEWVADWYAPYSPYAEPLIDPRGPTAGTGRVRRGGSFRMNAKSCAAWSRKSSEPEHRSDDLGFRIVRSPKSPS
ncbi:MAG TPA: SUMF1/EgtB/PvdO family nonheme iron enzyme [Thermoanaerobaculia bacterium]|nr:SUMF1/EgtB/PvdO family nonheme iron enzyme [Thermoanaerobaculia bacterium]